MPRLRNATICLVLVSTLTFLTGCSPDEEKDTASVLQSALNDFTQNRSLTEQFVRDVKSRLDPSDPAYVQAMESYQDARDVYNRYLDAVENGQKHAASRSLREASASNVESAATDFISDATRALRPGQVRRRGDFQRSIEVPSDLQATVARLPKGIRNKLVDRFDGQIRWRSWNQL